jgi:hypothetical protein
MRRGLARKGSGLLSTDYEGREAASASDRQSSSECMSVPLRLDAGAVV